MSSQPAAGPVASVPATTRYRVVLGSRESRTVMVIGLGAAAILATLPLWGPTGVMRFLVEVFVFLALAQMWNLLAGYAGLVSIGQQAFVGLGAYGLFIFSDIYRLPSVLPVIVTALVGGIVALAISPFIFRLGGGYFAIGTWVVAEVFRLIIVQFRELGAGTGASIQSLISMPAAERQAETYWLALALGFGSVVVVTVIMRSRLGLALRAVRDSEVAARTLGVNVFRAKLVIWVLAAIGCAAAGSVFYMQALRIQPAAAFGIDWTAKMLFIAIIGGIGRVEGPLVGTVAFFLLQSLLAGLGPLYLVILGAVAIIVTLFAPGGLWGLITARFRIVLFGIQRELLVRPPAVEGSQ